MFFGLCKDKSSKKTSPDVGLIKLVIIFAIVDLPDPDSPTKPKDSPSII